MTRAWPVPSATREETVSIQLHEPGLTGDNLGLKTWGSSYVLAKNLSSFNGHLPSRKSTKDLKVLELGSGTGLVGLAAAITWQCPVTLTDLPEIIPNLKHNIALNEQLWHDRLTPKVTTLDWTNPPNSEEVGGTFDASPQVS